MQTSTQPARPLLWHQIKTRDQIAQYLRTELADYAAYNYGPRHPITKACVAGDLPAFGAATDHVTQDMDIKLANVSDKIHFADRVAA